MVLTYRNNSGSSSFVFRVDAIVTVLRYSSVNTDIEFSPTPRTKESETPEENSPELLVAYD